ncbi:piggyBac transposable element-derived protein 2-like [Macrobrachium rosenbergii]|uniref:piggyBac transposable element-derived protein 2-like n=1 Tax=Macrobrachium rosenbergii TaxID=79674 RepID=UPI0034D45F4D
MWVLCHHHLFLTPPPPPPSSSSCYSDIVILPPSTGDQPVDSDDENLSFDLHSVPAGDCEAHLGKGMFAIYKLFFPDEIISHLTPQTNLYAQRDNNDKDFSNDEEDMTKFLGLVLISGYHSLPFENDYWSTSGDLAIPVFPNTMSREKFKSIKKYFHVADNNNLEK